MLIRSWGIISNNDKGQKEKNLDRKSLKAPVSEKDFKKTNSCQLVNLHSILIWLFDCLPVEPKKHQIYKHQDSFH